MVPESDGGHNHNPRTVSPLTDLIKPNGEQLPLAVPPEAQSGKEVVPFASSPLGNSTHPAPAPAEAASPAESPLLGTAETRPTGGPLNGHSTNGKPARPEQARRLAAHWSSTLSRPPNSYDDPETTALDFLELLRQGWSLDWLLERLDVRDKFSPYWEWRQQLPKQPSSLKRRNLDEERVRLEGQIARARGEIDRLQQKQEPVEDLVKLLATKERQLAALTEVTPAEARSVLELAETTVEAARQALPNDGWDQPIPLASIPEAEPFPLDLLPPSLSLFAVQAAESLSCPPDYIAVPMLAIAGTMIGTARSLRIKSTWHERACLWTVVVALPGSAKSPALLDFAARPVFDEQKRLMGEHAYALEAWRADRARLKADGKTELPTPPRAGRLAVGDFTTEVLSGLLRDNPRGLVMIEDELSAWAGRMNQYHNAGRGSDNEYFRKMWSSAPIIYDRKNQTDGGIYVPRPFLGIAGSIPPDLLPKLRGARHVQDGFFDRPLFSYPVPTAEVEEQWHSVEPDVEKAWADRLRWLRALHIRRDADGLPDPTPVRLDADAKVAWQAFTKRLADEMNSEAFPDCLRGAWKKMRAYGARLALVLHFLRVAEGDSSLDEQQLSAETMEQAARLTQYFQSHARKVYASMDADYEAQKATRLLEWIERARRPSFKRWHAFEAVKSAGKFPTPQSLDGALARLAQHGYLRPKSNGLKSGPGRPAAPEFEVNPLILGGDPVIL